MGQRWAGPIKRQKTFFFFDYEGSRPEFSLLDSLRFKRLRDGATSGKTDSFSVFAPLNEVAPVG
jgi:hypothetical protein